MKQLFLSFFSLLIITGYSGKGFSQTSLSHSGSKTKEALPRGLPEAEGVSSESILNFLDAAGKSKTEFHSFMFLRHGKVIAEGWWNPYRSDLKHSLYSVSKSFTATAIGFAVSEGRLNVNDKVISFFPKSLPDTVSAFLSALTVKDVLIMSDGQDPDPTPIVTARDSNWVKGFLATPILYKPGSKFLYNSLGTYMLSAIVQKVTGQKVIDYLRPRLFEPLGIEGMDWEVDALGINTGGWGLRLKTEDMAKFGQLFLQKGKWKDKQVLPASWVEAASTAKIIQHPDLPQAKKDSSDWEQGYCYQMWRCRNNAFRADGAFGQFIIVMPDKDAVIAITAETSSMQEEINLVWKYLFPGIQKDKLPVNKNTTAMLEQKLAVLSLPPITPEGLVSLDASRFASRIFTLEPNEKHIETISLQFKNNICSVAFKTDTAIYRLAFGLGKWEAGETTRRGPYLVSGAKANLTGLPPFKVDGSYAWKDEHTLELKLRYIESPHTETIVCHFEEKNISVEIERSFDFGSKKLVLKGGMK